MASVELNEENRRKLATFQLWRRREGQPGTGAFNASVIMKGSMSQGEGN